ncbi:Concanavalin A-like lectin/glucanase domain containing protein [Rhypophila decipiens]
MGGQRGQDSGSTTAQKIGTTTPEVHPVLQTQTCTLVGGCKTKLTKLVTDSLAHPIHSVTDPSKSCQPLDPALCPDQATCAQNCVIEGIQSYDSIGVFTSGTSLTLREYLLDGTQYKKFQPRVYLLAEDDLNYEPLRLLNSELSFDVDISALGCGMNGALYLSEMDMSGSRNSNLNPAGAQYGTGYCDAQCFKTPAFINGLANINGSGSCCNEMDIWEANSRSTVYTPHTCIGVGSFLCSGKECDSGVGVCDKPGCSLNTFGLGAPGFYGRGRGEHRLDSTRPFTVVTQFWTADNTTSGDLIEIRRLYVQDGSVFPSTAETTNGAVKNIPGGWDGSITEDYCTARYPGSDFTRLGGLKGMGQSLARGMMLIFSIWNSDGDFMSWLDGQGSGNGPCNATEGDPVAIVKTQPDTSVTFSNIRWGEIGFIGSTFKVDGPGSMSAPGTGNGVAAAAATNGVVVAMLWKEMSRYGLYLGWLPFGLRCFFLEEKKLGSEY